MEQVYTSAPYLPFICEPNLQVFLLQFFNQLQINTTQHNVQNVLYCVESLEHQERHQQELLATCENRTLTLNNENLLFQKKHLSNGNAIDALNISLQVSSQKYEEKIRELEKQVRTENAARIMCERETKLQKDQLQDVARKNVTKAIQFTNQYKKYAGSGNLNFAVAVYGDPEIKEAFRLSGNIIGKEMTNQEARSKGFSCGNGRYIPKCFKCDGTDDCGNLNDERNCSTTVLPVGARVVRGTDWAWTNQDGDTHGIGTVIQEGINGEWNTVKWDNDVIDNYRIGKDGKIDLRAAAGYFCPAT